MVKRKLYHNMLNVSCSTAWSKTFHILCLLSTATLVLWCIHEYRLDNDITEIKLRKYHHRRDDIHPSLTVCYTKPFLNRKFVKYNKNLKSSSLKANDFIYTYKSLIDGGNVYRKPKVSEAELDELYKVINGIDYDGVTIELKDIISQFYIRITITSENIDEYMYTVDNNSNLVLNVNETYVTDHLSEFYHVEAYVSARQSNLKCFTFDVPYSKSVVIRELGMRLNTSIFPWTFSPTQMYFTLTYPKQILRTSLGNRIKFPKAGSPYCCKFEIAVGAMEVFKRRNKKTSPCNENWKEHDASHLRYIIENVGCQPKHWKINSSKPICNSFEQHDKATKEVFRHEGFMPPCRSVEILKKTTKWTKPKEHRCEKSSGSYLNLRVYLDEESFYKEIVLVRAYTIQSLIGNAGNYDEHIFIISSNYYAHIT